MPVPVGSLFYIVYAVLKVSFTKKLSLFYPKELEKLLFEPLLNLNFKYYFVTWPQLVSIFSDPTKALREGDLGSLRGRTNLS